MTQPARPDVSICVISHNSRDDLEVCLTTLRQVMPSDLTIELVVVDNTGEDGSTEYVQQTWPSAWVLTNQSPLGFSANVNQAVARSRARYVLVMNPDVILLPNAIEAMVQFMDAHVEVGACGPKTLYPDGTLQATCRRFPKWGTVFWRWLRLDRLAQPAFYRQFLMQDCDHDESQAVDWVMGSCMLIRRDSFQAVGGFDDGFFLYYEDIDFCRRLWQAGLGVQYVPEAVIIHAYRRQSAKTLLNAVALVHLRSILRYRGKHGLAVGQVVGRRSTANLALLLIISDVIITELALQLGRYARLWLPIFGAYPYPNPSPLNTIVYLIVPIIWVTVFSLIGLYRPNQIRQSLQETGRLLFGVMLSGLILAGSLYALFLYEVYVPRLLLAYFLVFDAILLIGSRALFHQILSRNGLVYRPRALLVGTSEVSRSISRWIGNDWQAQLDLIGTIPWLEDLSENGATDQARHIARIVQELRIDEVILTPPLPVKGVLARIVSVLREHPVDIEIVPDFLDLALHQATVENLYGVSAISLRRSPLQGSRRVLKRVFDLTISIPLFVLSLPAMLFIAIAIRFDSPGPVIFRQQRVGENGRLFWIYKFRSMVEGAEQRLQDVMTISENGDLVYKARDDPRVTRVGRVLRRWSLDELPQLWNVIRGEMSLVGPRPELPFILEHYEDWQYKRLAVPPGMTGWWQVRHRAQRPMHLSTEEDLFYIEHFSIWLDIQILVKTVWSVLSGRGAF